MDKQIINLVPWYGGDCPVPDDTPTIVQFGDGDYVDIIYVPQNFSELWGQRGDDVEGFITAYAPVEFKIETPRIDRSLRGWVLVEMVGTSNVWFAAEDGIHTDSSPDHGIDETWDECETRGYTIRRLTVEDLEGWQ